MEEKFSVSLELMIQKFKDKAKQVQDVSKNVANKIKDNMSVNVGGGAFKGMTAESELLLNKINDIKATLQMTNDDPKLLPKQDILEMRVELEKLENQYNKINQSSNMFSSSFNKIQDGMNKSLKSAKRFTLSLFGIQSVYRMLSRASSSYLAQDTETSSKIQSAWIGLGSVFAPLLQTIANFAIKAVSYINVFIKALTGTDFLANAMSKSMNKANKSAGALSKTLAGFDEITNLDTSAGGASVDTSWIDSFKNVELDPNVVAWLENIAIKMQPIVDFVKDAFTWIIANKEIAIGFIIGLSAAMGILSGAWQTKIMALGIGLAIAGIIKLVKELIEWIKNPSWEQFTKVLDGLALALIGVGIAMIAFNATNPVGWIILAIGLVVSLASLIIKNWDVIKEKTMSLINWFKSSFPTLFYVITEPFKNAWNTIKGVWDGAKTFFKGIKDVFVGIFTLDGNKIKNGLKQMLQGMGNIIIAFINGVLNAFLIPINTAIKLMNKIPGVNLPTLRVSIPKIPAFEVGTDYVPNDMMAQIHEGEKIIPKKFNSDEYVKRSDANNNVDVVKKLDELINRVENIEFSPYTTVRDVGEAGQKYRNQQSRIMGEELI
jgi:hypothetical protein